MLKGPYIVLAHLVAVHSESIGPLFPDKDPSAVNNNLALALGHVAKPLDAALVRLSDDIIVNLNPADPEHLLL